MPPHPLEVPVAKPGDVLIQFEHVQKRFGPKVIYSDLSLDIRRGEVMTIMGPSGVGKSVTIKHILGLLRPDSGEVWVGGKNMSLIHGRELAEHRKIFGMHRDAKSVGRVQTHFVALDET